MTMDHIHLQWEINLPNCLMLVLLAIVHEFKLTLNLIPTRVWLSGVKSLEQKELPFSLKKLSQHFDHMPLTEFSEKKKIKNNLWHHAPLSNLWVSSVSYVVLDVCKCWMCPWAVMNGTDLVTSIKLAPGLSFPYWQSSGMISGWFAK